MTVVPDELFATGQAREAEVLVYSETVEVSFRRDEACIGSRTLGRTGGRWVVEESVFACD